MTAPIELSRPLRVDRLRADGQELVITADPQERRALEKRLGLVAIESLTAVLKIAREEGSGLVVVRGTVTAQIEQSCIVSFLPVRSSLAFAVERWYGDSASAMDQDEIVIDPEAPDEPDPIQDGVIDLGELVSEELALEINPYPRASEEAQLTAHPGQAAEESGPFSKLAILRPRKP